MRLHELYKYNIIVQVCLLVAYMSYSAGMSAGSLHIAINGMSVSGVRLHEL